MSPDDSLLELMGPREVIGQAIAVLMHEHEVTRDTAFEMLVEGSSSSHQRVRTVAAAILRQSHRAE